MSLCVTHDRSNSDDAAKPDINHSRSFGIEAGIYASYRPEYPDAIFDALSRTMQRPPGRVIELGAGSGQATRELARRFSHVTAVEPDARLLDLMSPPDNVSLLNMRAEDAEFEADSADAVVTASSFHWMDQAVMCRRIATWLRPGGVFFPFLFGPFQVTGPDAARSIFKRHSSNWGPYRKSAIGLNANYGASIKANGAFEIVELIDLEFRQTMTAREAAGVLSTLSYVRAFAADNEGAQRYFSLLSDELSEAHEKVELRAPLGGVVARLLA